MRSKVTILCLGVLIGAILVNASGRSQEKGHPWLEPENPTQLDWLALEKQASEGVNSFGEDGVTINFYVGSESNKTGVILCDLAFTHDVTASKLQLIEDGIKHRFELERQIYPWARVKIVRKSAPF